ncbi:sensor histidine kinase [Nonomuraea longicatena]|uniref:sensor histidine kinase n=1 Tax=Nonomuraea longicatena TaxID=83682 RepID=UPI0031CEC7C2
MEPATVRKWLSTPALDYVIAGVLALMVVFGTDYPSVLALGLLATIPQAIRRQRPVIMLGMTLLGGLGLGALLFMRQLPLYSISGSVVLAVLVSAVLSLYTLLGLLSRTLAWALTTVIAITFVLAGVLLMSDDPANALFLAALAVGAALVTDLGRSRSKVREVEQEGVDQLIEAQREQAVLAERARIAREMHDVVAHSISMVAVQAEAAPYTLQGLSEETKAEFAEIAHSARTTLAEMRRLLGVLRADIPTGPETAPQPGLARLDSLIGQHDGEVDLDVVGEPADLPQAVDVSAYRILQECLANAARHAPGSRVSIELAHRPNLLVIRVANDGPAAEIGSGGHGLIGMRERAVGLGGWFAAEPVAGGGFLVRAGLPLD